MTARPTLATMLSRIWSHYESSSTFGNPSLAEKVTLTLLVLLAEFSLRGVCARLGRFRVISTEIYHASIIVALGILSIACAPQTTLALILLTYLVYEIVGWSLFNIFVEAKDTELRGRRSAIQAFLWVTYSYLVITWAYGLYYWFSQDIINSSGKLLPTLQDGIYFSVMTITTTGYGDYTPQSATITQVVVMTEPFVGLIILSLYFAVLVSAVSEIFKQSI